MGKRCKNCGDPFKAEHTSEKYCSAQCRKERYLITLKCPICKENFRRDKYQAARTKTNICSTKCARVFTSKRMTEMNIELNPERMTLETRKALRKARLDMNLGEGKAYKKYLSRHVHRIEAEKKIGRKLKPGEVVHHKDNNKLNNAHDNLEVLSSQAEHARLHAKEGTFKNPKKKK